jgi:drug/metabolite transporter (DMT)-like permease
MTIQTLDKTPVRRSAWRRAIPLAAGAGFVVFWSCGFIGARWGTEYSSAFDLLAWRYLLAGSVAAVVLLIRRPRVSRDDLITQAVMAFFSQFVYLGLIFIGIDHGISAGVTALIGALQPILIATVAGPLLGERVTGLQWVGLLLGVAGVGMVVADDLDASNALLFLLPIGGLLGLVIGTVFERHRKPTVGLLNALCLQTVVSAILFVSLTTATGQLTLPREAGFYGAALWLVVLATGGGWGLYLVNLRLSGATRISSLMYLVPPTTMVFAFLLFHETIGALAAFGMVVCAVAVVLIRLRCGHGGTAVAGQERATGVASVHRGPARGQQPD